MGTKSESRRNKAHRAAGGVAGRERAQEGLRESEANYREFVEKANDGITIIQDSVIKYANPRSLAILGYTPAEIIGTPMAHYVHPDELPKMMNREQRRTAGEHVDPMYETALVHKDGSRVDVELNPVAITYQGKPAFLVIGRDITERKRAEEAVREAEKRYKAIFNNRLQMVIIYNHDGLFLDANDCALEKMGYTREDLGKLSFNDIIHPDDLPKAMEALAKLLATGSMEQSDEFRVITRSGGTLYIETITIPLELGADHYIALGVAHDLTERKHMEETLRRSEQKLKRYLESSPDAIYISDSKGAFLYGNRAAERITGYRQEELIGKNFLEVGLLPPKYLNKAAKVQETNMAGDPTGPLELELRRKDGSLIPIEISTFPIGEGEDTEVIGIARDISRRRQAEEEKQSIEQQLQLAGRLAAVGELAAGIAHELNNPLAAVQAYAQFLASRRDLDDTVKSDVETIYKEAVRAARTTGNLLSFARRHRPEKSLVSINEVIEKSLELHAYRMKVNNIGISTDLSSELPRTMADFYQMQQVFVNLITNAEQAMTEAHDQGTLVVRTEMAGDMIRTTFTDDGPGIPEENLKRIFDPFFTTKEVGKGTGLGLAICFGIVQDHGGRLYATSEPGEGTTFVVEIPVVSENQPAIEQTDSASVQNR